MAANSHCTIGLSKQSTDRLHSFDKISLRDCGADIEHPEIQLICDADQQSAFRRRDLDTFRKLAINPTDSVAKRVAQSVCFGLSTLHFCLFRHFFKRGTIL